MKYGIVGHGEIGKSIERLYLESGIVPLIKDIQRNDGLEECDVLHICIPWSENFIASVVSYVKQYQTRNQKSVVMIHSTVPVGTTTKIINASTVPNICHVPIRGLHPNLLQGIKTFPLYIGTTSSSLFCFIQRHFNDLRITDLVYCDKPETTELAKLLDTTYYGVCIAFHKEAAALCQNLGLDFNEVMTNYNLSYNEGYPKLGKPNVVRPVLTNVPGPIGGHCVVPNAQILAKTWKSEVLDLILKYGGK